MTTMNAARLLYVNIFLLVTLGEWLYEYFEPQKNAGNWLAALAGAFVIRMRFPGLPLKQSLTGILVGFLVSLFVSPTLVKQPFFNAWESITVFGSVALVADVLVQLVSYLLRFIGVVGDYTIQHPADAWDSGVERASKLTELLIKIKTSLLSLFTKS